MSDSEETISSGVDVFGSEKSSDDDDSSITGLYNNEPEYSENEYTSRNSSNLSESTDSESNLDSSRLENLHWCYCRNCVICFSMTLDECKCCRECNILEEKLQVVKCITESEDFKILCLNRTVLETACIRHRRYENKFQSIKTFINK